MENKESKKGLIVLCIILMIAVIGLTAYVTYDKVLNNDNVTTNDDNRNNADNEINKISIVSFDNDSIAILYDREVYVSTKPTSFSNDYYKSLYNEDFDNRLSSTPSDYKQYDFKNLEFYDINNNKFEGMKLNISDVKGIFSFLNGQSATGNTKGIFILKNDGTVFGISFYSLLKNKTDVTQFTELKNIDKFVLENNDDGYSTYAVDKNNIKYNMNVYVPNNYKNW